ncbi:MAG: hypothetical protein AAGB06_06935, partial [Verrucomicrobiota bacterium]
LWPTNPEIQKFTQRLLERNDVREVASVDFDRYVRQEDFRAIFNDRFRLAAALANDASRNEEFLRIMKRMEVIESAMAQAKELNRIDNTFGAWEVLERVYRQYPNDQLLNRMRGDFAIRASEFASVIAQAGDAEDDGDLSKALLMYLKAKQIYPASYFVEGGIGRAVESILLAKAEAASEASEGTAQE